MKEQKGETMKRWYWFEAIVNGSKKYLGKCEATEAEVRRQFPYSLIEASGLVTIFSMPKSR